MQPLLDGPRAELTEDQVRNLLQSHSAIQINYGALALDRDFGDVADISGYMTPGSSISSDITATVHRTCSLNIDADVTDSGWSYLSGFIKPYMIITDLESGVKAQFNLGVYTLTTPSRVLGTKPATLSFSGYDLNYLLRQPIGDSFEVVAGTDPAQAAALVISAAIPEVEVNVVPSGSTLPKQLSWPFDASQPTTYLEIVQTLLKSIGYREVWVDWEGEFQIGPYVDMNEETAEWTFDVEASDNIVADKRSQDIDIYTVPNWWRFVMADLADLPVEGISQFTWEDASRVNPGSTYNRGRTIKHIETVTVTKYSDLLAYAQKKIVAMLSPGETFSAQTQPFPLAWHMDLIDFLDPALALSLPSTPSGERRVLATTWTLALDGMSDMDWSWRTINDESATLGLATTEAEEVAA